MFFIVFGLFANAQEVIKAMAYNLLEFPSAPPSNRAQILQAIIDQYEPDIFMVEELESEAGANIILNSSLNDEGDNYAMAPFEPTQSGDPDHQQLVFYRKAKFTLESTEVIPAIHRDINHYQLKLNTADGDVDPVLIDVFVTHLKSSQGTANKQLRLEMVQAFTTRLETMDPNSFVLFGGDLNLYTQSEPAYQELLDPTNNIVMVDPLDRPGSWHDKLAFADIHSQSTRISSGPFGTGAGGGMDDRFDFITMSSNMQTDPKLQYITGSYKSFGNNGNCFNLSVNDASCTGDFSPELRDYLYNMSDHLPIVMEMQTNKEIVLKTEDFAKQSAIILKSTLVKDELNIQVNSNISENISFYIYNLLGQKLMTVNSNNAKEITIPVSQLSSGIYYLKTSLPTSRTFKFLKTS